MISAVLKSDIDRYADDLRRTSRLLACARAGKLGLLVVGRYFAGISYLIGHTSFHLTLARQCAVERGSPRLARYFEQKLREEAGHEKWAEADLVRLDGLLGTPIPRDPSPSAVMLMRSVEQGIRSAPHRYLAYILFTEYLTVSLGPEWVAALHDCCGVPRAAMTVATHHIELDKHHVSEGLREIDDLVDDPGLYEALRATLHDSMQHFSAFCDDVCSAAA